MSKMKMHCRICSSPTTTPILNLGTQTLTSRFPPLSDYSTPSGPLELIKCSQCGLVQLKDSIEAKELYEHNYGYRSGLTQTMRTHLEKYNQQVQSMVELKKGDYVLDIGSNDATFLKFYPRKINKIGIDPTGQQFASYYDGIKLIPTYFTKQNLHANWYKDIKFKVISSIAMFYDLPDPISFARDIYDLLAKDGIWTFEQSYILTMLQQNSFDTICHEHLEYYAVKQIKYICDVVGFKIIDISCNESNGGSFRIFVAKRKSNYLEATELINSYLKREQDAGLDDIETYNKFMKSCDQELVKLKYFVDIVNDNQQQIWVYGASTKGNTLLQYAGLDNDKIKYAVERNLEKVGKMTPGTHIEIISEDTMRKNPPSYLLVLPWHFRNEIIQREHEYLENSGCLIFPLPHFEIVSSRPKLLVTGIDGQIGHYIPECFVDHKIFGLSKSLVLHPNMTKIEMDIRDKKLELLLQTLQPEKLIHLAGISQTEIAEAHPSETIEVNGLVITRICEILHRNQIKCRVFNASSSEIYKDHLDYLVSDNDINFKPYNVYSYGKLLGHQMVSYYAQKYGAAYSNGIIFTTESRYRSPNFLIKKISLHLAQWKAGNHHPLKIGSLNSFRTLCHACDVVRAIRTILEQPTGENYVISGCESFSMLDIVLRLGFLMGLTVSTRDSMILDSNDEVIIMIDNNNIRGKVTNIRGNPAKLLSLGWKPSSLDEILSNFICGDLGPPAP